MIVSWAVDLETVTRRNRPWMAADAMQRRVEDDPLQVAQRVLMKDRVEQAARSKGATGEADASRPWQTANGCVGSPDSSSRGRSCAADNARRWGRHEGRTAQTARGRPGGSVAAGDRAETRPRRGASSALPLTRAYEKNRKSSAQDAVG